MNTMSRPFPTQRLLLATLLGLAASGPAAALDWGGYFRAGPGSTREGASRACYTLPGAGGKFRLGNECDFYGEFKLSQPMTRDGVEYRATLMTNLYGNGTDTGDAKMGINQMYVEAKGLDVAPGSTFWVGKRFYDRTEVYFIDTKFTQQDGVGAGVADIDVGAGKLAFAYFHDDGTNNQPGDRLSADLADISVNPNGKLRLMAGLTKANFDGGKTGTSFTVQHAQVEFLGVRSLTNTLWLQAAQGTANLNSGFGTLTAGSSTRGLRVADSLMWQQGPFGGQTIVMREQTRNDAGIKTTQTSAGGRLSYAFTRTFKLLGEAGTVSRAVDGSATARLSKLTIAPTLSVGPALFDRPELRFYVTHAKWNAAAGNVTGTPAFDGKTSGTSFGAQVEMWF